MPHDFQMRIAHEMFQIVLRASEEVIDDEHVMAVIEHAFSQMGAQETCAAGDENTFANGIVLHRLMVLWMVVENHDHLITNG